MVPERERVGDREREGEGEQADLKRQSFPAIQTVKALNSSVDGEALGSRTLTAQRCLTKLSIPSHYNLKANLRLISTTCTTVIMISYQFNDQLQTLTYT